jgi:DNA-binding PadR family transcriptional regulator
MAATQRGELSAGMAVLGLLIQQPDSAAGIGQRLARDFPRARFARSVVHNALPSLEAQGLVCLFERGSERSFDRYCASDAGRALFRRWLRQPCSKAPTLRDAVHARLAFAEPEDLLALIDAVLAEQRACAKEYASACAQLVAGPAAEGAGWRSSLARLACSDEATLWLARLKRLERLLAGLQRLRAQLDAQTVPATTRQGAAAQSGAPRERRVRDDARAA